MGKYSASKEYGDIIFGFKRNDEMVLKHFYLKVYPKVKLYVIKNKGNEEQAKDIFQESFIACWKNIKENKVASHENIEAYLFTISKNKWIDYLRSISFKKTVSIHGINKPLYEHETEMNHEESEILRKNMLEALLQLNENCRRILNLYYYERHSMKEISTKLGIDSASARNKKYRCMEQLRSLALKLKYNEQDL